MAGGQQKSMKKREKCQEDELLLLQNDRKMLTTFRPCSITKSLVKF